MALEVVVASAGPPSIKPYCGARVSNALEVQDTRLGSRFVHGRPVPAWADVGVASHLRSFCSPVPAVFAAPGADAGMPDVLQRHLDCRRVAFKLGIVISSFVENLVCYLAFLQTNDPDANFYNKFEAYSLQLPGMETALLTLTVLNSLYLFVFWTLVGVVRLDVFKVMAIGRLGLSAPCGVLCFILVMFAESTKVMPFLCTVLSLLYLMFAVLGILDVQTGNASNARKVCCFAALTILGLIMSAWCLAFLLDGVAFLRDESCLASRNRAMPVKISELDDWLCVRWGQTQRIAHSPDPSEAPYVAHCSTPFHAFGRVPGPGQGVPGPRAQLVQCPPQCQALGLGTLVIGCGVYDARSSVCSAAVQMGMLATNQGGVVRVVGRKPMPGHAYGMCNLNGVLSASAAGPGASPDDLAANGTQREWAFYFQEAAGTESDDLITLHGWRVEEVSALKQPWRSYIADVSWVLAGGTMHRQEVRLGPPEGMDASIQVNFCRDSSTSLNSCP